MKCSIKRECLVMKYKGAYSKFIKLLDILSKEWQGEYLLISHFGLEIFINLKLK